MALEAVVFGQLPGMGNDPGAAGLMMEGGMLEDWNWVYNYSGYDTPTTTTTPSSCVDHQEPSRRAVQVPCECDHELHVDPPVMLEHPVPAAAGPFLGRRKRRRSRIVKDNEEIENQRRIHIDVERNRRKLMNQHLAVLRSLMPPSYVQRGDQGSTVGGAINFVRELEQHLQYLEGHRRHNNKQNQYQQYCRSSTSSTSTNSGLQLAGYDYYPLLSDDMSSTTSPAADATSDQDDNNHNCNASAFAKKQSDSAIVEVAMTEGYAKLKVISTRQPKLQLSKVIVGLISLGLAIYHLNVTSIDNTVVVFSFCLKVEDECKLSSVNDIASSVHEVIARIPEQTLPVC